MRIPLERVKIDPERSGRVYPQEELLELALDMGRETSPRPIVVREDYNWGDELPSYIVLDGDRRYLAAQLLKWKAIEAEIIRPDYMKIFAFNEF